MTHSRGLSALVALAMTSGCRGGTVEWSGELTDSAGVTIVANPEAGLWREGNGWSVVEELRIGAHETLVSALGPTSRGLR